MSCPNELTWSVYVDGELERDALRSAEMHLVSCRSCRSQVLALRDENAALTNVLHERTPAWAYPRPQQAATRELSWGLPVAVAAVTAVLTIGGLLLEMRLPGMLDLLNPKRLIGVNEMVFDTIFTLRDRWPELFEAGASVGAMAAFSALGCATLHALSNRITKSSSLMLLFLLVSMAPDSAKALDIRSDQDTHVAAGETVSETLVCTGDVVTIEGTVDGDLIVGAERFSMRGTVTGNLYFFASEVELDGVVQGTVIGAGDQVRLAGRVDGGVNLGADRLNVTDGAQIGRDAILFGEGVRISGAAARDVTFLGEWIEVRARIARDLHVLGADRVALLDNAQIGRNVTARLWGQHDEVEQTSGAIVQGEVTVSRDSIVHEHFLSRYGRPSFYVAKVVAAAAAFLFGLLIYVLDPRLFEADLPNARKFFGSLGTGFIIVLAGPVALVLIALTVIGIPIAALGGFLFISSLYTSYVLVAGLVGQAIRSPSRSGHSGIGAFAPSLLIGVLVLSLAAALPFVGSAVRIVAILFGMGCLFERVRGLQALNLRGLRN